MESDGNRELKTIFIAGNKRSGSSVLCKILNSHPKVFVPFETDIIWILYQLYYGREPGGYIWDDWNSMYMTLSQCKAFLPEPGDKFDVREVFLKALRKISNTKKWMNSNKNVDYLIYVGDKKPVQYCDPKIVKFIKKHFPEAKFIHSIRDPRACVSSMVNKVSNRYDFWPDWWREPVDFIFDRWALHEERANRLDGLHYRFEDLVKNPKATIKKIFDFLGLHQPIIANYQFIKDANPKYKPWKYKPTERAKKIMAQYKYK